MVWLSKLTNKFKRFKCRHLHHGIKWNGGAYYFCAKKSCNLKWDVPTEIVGGWHQYKLRQTQDPIQTMGEQ